MRQVNSSQAKPSRGEPPEDPAGLFCVSFLPLPKNHVNMGPLRIYFVVLLLAASGVSSGVASAQPMDPELDIYYAVDRNATLYHVADSTQPYMHLNLREPIYTVADRDPGWVGWKRVRTLDGANGIVRSEQISNVWLRISKSSQTLYAYRGANLIARIPTDLGYNFFSDKQKRGSNGDPDHWRTPEGEFFVASKNGGSQFYKALVLNYPNAEDARRGLQNDLITQDEYDSIVLAEKTFTVPPMNTELGGWIEIHGDGTGLRRNWTQGCVAVQNVQMDRLWEIVQVGTPVLIDP